MTTEQLDLIPSAAEPLDPSVAEALRSVREAEQAIEDAREAKRARQLEFADMLRTRLAALRTECGDEAITGLLSRLYWDEQDSVRVADLQAASGLSAKELIQLVGSRDVEAKCRSCRRPTTVRKRSRSGHVWAQCPPCRLRDLGGSVVWPPARQSAPQDELVELFDFLVTMLARRRCDDRLTLSRAWAASVGRDPETLARQLEQRGGSCDCEVLLYVADDSWFPAGW